MINALKRAHADGSLFLWLALLAFGLFFFGTLDVNVDGDFRQFYTASNLFLHRLNAYDPSAYTDANRYGFLYPPLAIYLTLIPSLFSIKLAIGIWNTVCLMAHAAVVYLWIEMAWPKPVTVQKFIPIFLMTFSANCIWAHWIHHLIFPVLLFCTFAYWHQLRGNPFIAGIFGGLMLIKPHLALIPLIALWLHEKRKSRFVFGVLMVTLLSLAPYFLGYRPASDLKGMLRAAHQYEYNLYYLDEQSVPAVIYRLVSADLKDSAYTVQKHDFILHLAHGNRVYEMFKGLSFAVCLGTYLAFALKINRYFSKPICYALLLALSLFFNIHTHGYDGILLLPALICGLSRHADKIAQKPWVTFSLMMNIVLPVLIVTLALNGHVRTSPTGLCSLLYFSVFGLMMKPSVLLTNQGGLTCRA